MKCRHLVLTVSSAGAADKAPGTFWIRAFWAHLWQPVALSGLCSSESAPFCLCPGPERTAQCRGRGDQWGWGAVSVRWRNRAHTHHCAVPTSQHPPPSRWPPVNAQRIILQRLAFLLLINRTDVVFSSFCFYHHPLGLFSSSIKLSSFNLSLTQISQKLQLFTVCEKEGGSTVIYRSF